MGACVEYVLLEERGQIKYDLIVIVELMEILNKII